jgi:hypothetical protein
VQGWKEGTAERKTLLEKDFAERQIPLALLEDTHAAARESTDSPNMV